MTKKINRIVWSTTVLFVGGLLLFTWLLHRAAPGPADQEILGGSLGHFRQDGQQAYFSGKQLACQPADRADAPYRTVCTLAIDGQPLTIWAARNGPESNQQLSGVCTAVYADETLDCQIGSRHVHVHWFALIEKPGALGDEQMADLRRQYLWENLPEDFYMGVIGAVGVITAVLAVANLFTLLWNRSRSRLVFILLGAVPTAFVFYYVGLLSAFWITGPFFD